MLTCLLKEKKQNQTKQKQLRSNKKQEKKE